MYSNNLIEFGRKLLLKLIDTPFNDYNAIENLKSSIKLVSDSSNIATPETIREIFNNSFIEKHYGDHLDSTDIIENNFNKVFSFLSPYNSYNIEDMEAAMTKAMVDDIPKHSVSLIRKMISLQSKMQNLFTRIHKVNNNILYYPLYHVLFILIIFLILHKKPFKYHCQSTTSVHQKIIGLYNRAIINLIKGLATLIYISKQSFRYENEICMKKYLKIIKLKYTSSSIY